MGKSDWNLGLFMALSASRKLHVIKTVLAVKSPSAIHEHEHAVYECRGAASEYHDSRQNRKGAGSTRSDTHSVTGLLHARTILWALRIASEDQPESESEQKRIRILNWQWRCDRFKIESQSSINLPRQRVVL